MSEPKTTPHKHVVQDKFASRMPQAIAVSVVVNIVFWSGAIVFLKTRPLPPKGPITVQRIVLDKKRPVPKLLPKKPIPVKIAQVPKTPQPEPEGAHNNIVTRKSPAKSGLHTSTVLAGGNLKQGANTAQQTAGKGTTPVSGPTQPTPPVIPPTPPVVPKPEPDPPKVETKPVAKPVPAVLPDPKPRLIRAPEPQVREAELRRGTDIPPELPDSLRQSASRTFVRVRFTIGTDGSSQVTIRTSSGNPDLDQRVVTALSKWKWNPRTENGDPVESEQLYKFEFDVE